MSGCATSAPRRVISHALAGDGGCWLAAAPAGLQLAWRYCLSAAGARLTDDCFLRTRSAGRKISRWRSAGLRSSSRLASCGGCAHGGSPGSRSSMTVRANSSRPATGKQRTSTSASPRSTGLTLLRRRRSRRAVSEPGAAGRAWLHAADLRGDFPPPALPGSGYGGRLVSLSAFGSCPPPWYLRRGLRFPAPPLVPQVSFIVCDGAASSQGTKVTGARAVGPLGRRFAAAWYRS